MCRSTKPRCNRLLVVMKKCFFLDSPDVLLQKYFDPYELKTYYTKHCLIAKSRSVLGILLVLKWFILSKASYTAKYSFTKHNRTMYDIRKKLGNISRCHRLSVLRMVISNAPGRWKSLPAISESAPLQKAYITRALFILSDFFFMVSCDVPNQSCAWW